jgi:hypothetical protein
MSTSASSSATTATPPPIYDISNISRSTTTFATGTNVCVGFAMSDDMTKAVDLQSGTAARFSTYNGSTWSAWTVFDSSSTIMAGVGDIDLTKDGLRGVLCNGWGNPNGRIYFFTWNVSTYTTCTRIVDNTARNYRAIALTDDGSRLVACTETAATGGVFFATWNGSNYDGLTQVSTTTIPPRIYSGICISDTGTRIAYLEQDGSGFFAPSVFFATWDNTNTTYVNEVRFNNIFTRPGDNRKIRMTGDASMIWLSKYNANFTTNQPTIYYTYWNNTTGTYNPVTPFYNNTIGVDSAPNRWGLWLKRDGTRLASTNYGSTTYELYTIPYASLGVNEPTYVYNNAALNFQLYNKTNTTIGTRDTTNRYQLVQTTNPKLVANSVRGNVFYLDASSTVPSDASGASISTVAGSFTPPNPFVSNTTVSFWIYYNYTTTDSFTFMTGGWFPFTFNAGKLEITIYYTGGGPTVTETTRTSSNQWVHYALTIDTFTNRYNLYKNGVVDVSGTNSYLTGNVQWGRQEYQTYIFALGSKAANPNIISQMRPLTIDDIRICRRAFTPAEVLSLYNTTNILDTIVTPSLFGGISYTNNVGSKTISGQTPSYQNGSYTFSASSIYNNDITYAPSKAFNLTSEFWHSDAGYTSSPFQYTGPNKTTNINSSPDISGEWIQIQFPYRITLQTVSLTPRPGVGGALPTSFVVVGSNNGTNWNIIYQQTSPTVPYTSNLNTICIPNASVPYQYIRLIGRLLEGAGFFQLGRLQYSGVITAL